jgi:hypothetical protein
MPDFAVSLGPDESFHEAISRVPTRFYGIATVTLLQGSM